MWASGGYGATPWAGGPVPAPPVGQQIPPPVAGGTRTYSYVTSRGVDPWAAGTWGGGGALALYPGGGIVVVPDPALGVMRLLVWWPDATGLQLLRTTGDGTVLPVRGGYPALPGATRRNWSTNPSVTTDLTGWTAGTGAPTITRIPVDDTLWAWRATIAGAGTCEVNIPRSVPSAQPITVAMDLRLSATPSALSVTATWADAGAVATAPSTATLSADDVVRSVDQFGRQLFGLTPPSNAVTLTGLRVTATGLPAGATMDGTRVRIALGASSSGTYVDGTMLGGVWTGAPDLSTSVHATVVEVVDGECPLDEPVTYILANPAFSGGRMVSEPVVLDSLGLTWMTIISDPANPRTISVREVPDLVRTIDRGVFKPLGRRTSVVVTGPTRRSASGTIGINALSGEDYEWLVGALDDGLPFLIRTPAEYHFTPRWLSLGDQTDSREGRLAYHDAWLISAPFEETDPPSALVA